MVKNAGLYLKVILCFVFVAIPVTHLTFTLFMAIKSQDLSAIKGLILLPISLVIGFIPATITAITSEALRQNSENERSYLCFTLLVTLFIITPYVMLLFFHADDIITPILLIVSSLIGTLLTGHLWWKLQTVKQTNTNLT